MTVRLLITYLITVFFSMAAFANSTEDSIDLFPSDIFDIKINLTEVLCQGDSTGALEVIATGGQEPYHYLWSTGDTLSSIDSLRVGTYAITVMDNLGCMLVDSFTLKPLEVIVRSYYPLCNSPFPIVTPDAYNTDAGFYDFEYLWSNGWTEPIIFGLTVGTYNLTITDENGCSAVSDSITIVERNVCDNVSANVYNIQHVSCFGGSDGAFDVGANTGCYEVRPVMYASGFDMGLQDWHFPNDFEATGLSVGTYSFYFVADYGFTECYASATVIIEEPADSITVEVLTQTNFCSEENLGSIALAALGDFPPFNYEWDDGSTNPQNDSLWAGQHTVTITDANGCSKVEVFSIVNILDIELLDQDHIIFNCNNPNPSLLLSPLNSSTFVNIKYEWTTANGNIVEVIDAATVKIDQAGIYNLLATDTISGCIVSNDIEVVLIEETELPLIEILTPDAKLCSENSTTILEGLASEDSKFNISWIDSTGTIISDELSVEISEAGTYTFSVQNTENSCLSEEEIVVLRDDILQTNPTITNTIVGNNDGAIRPNISGGIPPYYYLWDLGNSWANNVPHLSNLAAGEYILYVRDSDGCNSVFTYEVGLLTSTIDFEKEQNIHFTPNPSNGQITIIYDEKRLKNMTMNIYDIYGRKAFAKQNLSRDKNVNLSFLSTGIYYATFLINNEIIKTEKIIISN